MICEAIITVNRRGGDDDTTNENRNIHKQKEKEILQ